MPDLSALRLGASRLWVPWQSWGRRSAPSAPSPTPARGSTCGWGSSWRTAAGLPDRPVVTAGQPHLRTHPVAALGRRGCPLQPLRPRRGGLGPDGRRRPAGGRLARHQRRVAGRVAALATTAAVMAASWPALSERPQLLGFVLLRPLVAGWVATGHDGRARWCIVPLSWLWPAPTASGRWGWPSATGRRRAGAGSRCGPTEAASAGRGGSGPVGRLACVAGLPRRRAATPRVRLVLTPFTVGANGRSFVDEWLPTSARQPHVRWRWRCSSPSPALDRPGHRPRPGRAPARRSAGPDPVHAAHRARRRLRPRPDVGARARRPDRQPCRQQGLHPS